MPSAGFVGFSKGLPYLPVNKLCSRAVTKMHGDCIQRIWKSSRFTDKAGAGIQRSGRGEAQASVVTLASLITLAHFVCSVFMN